MQMLFLNIQQYSWVFGKTPKFTMEHSFSLIKDEKEIPLVSYNLVVTMWLIACM